MAHSSHAKTATVADFYANCATPSETVAHTLTVDPLSHSNGSYPTIAAALQAAKPGDTIALMTGDYGNFALSGINSNGFITIAAAPGQTPRFTNIFVGRYGPASHWRLTGLTVSGFYSIPDKRAQTSLVMVGSSDNIIFDHNNLYSAEGTIDWRDRRP